MGMFAEPPQANAPPFPQLGRHERDVDQSKQGVVADEQRAARRNPLDSVDLRLGDALQWCEDRRHPVHLRIRRSWRERRGRGGHGLGTAAAARESTRRAARFYDAARPRRDALETPGDMIRSVPEAPLCIAINSLVSASAG